MLTCVCTHAHTHPPGPVSSLHKAFSRAVRHLITINVNKAGGCALASMCTHTHTIPHHTTTTPPSPVLCPACTRPFLEQSEIPCIPFKELISCPVIALVELTWVRLCEAL